MKPINPHKLYKTASGNPVRIYAVDGSGEYPVHGAIETDDGWESASWTKEGAYRVSKGQSQHDLVEVIADDMPF